MLYLVLAILLFGFLIFIHEFGHFITAKWSGVQVNEFALGMGSVLWQRQKGETLYSLRLFPIGGFCAMEGEDGDSQNPHAFGNQSAGKQFLILVAGAGMNFLSGVVLIFLLMGAVSGYYVPVIAGLDDAVSVQGEAGLMVGDRICSINGSRIWTYSDLNLFLMRNTGEAMDIVVERDGVRREQKGLHLTPLEDVEGGSTYAEWYGIHVAVERATLPVKLRETLYDALDYVRLAGLSLSDLLSGQAGLQDMSGPIGIVGTVVEAGQSSAATGGVRAGVRSVVQLCAFLAINLAVMNLLPLPALDGGRIFFLLIHTLYTALTHKKINPKYEGYVHAIGLMLLLGLMALVAVNDILRLVR